MRQVKLTRPSVAPSNFGSAKPSSATTMRPGRRRRCELIQEPQTWIYSTEYKTPRFEQFGSSAVLPKYSGATLQSAKGGIHDTITVAFSEEDGGILEAGRMP